MFSLRVSDAKILKDAFTAISTRLRVNVLGTIHLNIHSHASSTGFEVLMSHAFTNKERIFYMIHLPRVIASSRVALDKMFSDDTYSTWLKNVEVRAANRSIRDIKLK